MFITSRRKNEKGSTELEQEKEYPTAENEETDSTDCGIQSRYPDFKKTI